MTRAWLDWENKKEQVLYLLYIKGYRMTEIQCCPTKLYNETYSHNLCDGSFGLGTHEES